MPGSLFKNLTFILLLWGISFSYAQTLTQEEFKTHLRWVLKSPKEQITIKKINNKITLETLNEDLYQTMVGDIAKLSKSTSYMKSFEYSNENYPAEPAKVVVELTDDSVELFSFFKEDQQKYVMDFWINKDRVASKKAAVAKVSKPVTKASTVKEVRKNKPIKNVLVQAKQSNKALSNESGFNIIDPEKIVESSENKSVRDFRYGAAFVWDYKPFLAPLEKDVNLKVKAPDYLYQVKDRNYEADPKEAHMQLSVKFYRQKKWGLMTKSIKLYEDKYGIDANKDINDFMKATSLIKNTIKQEIKPLKKGVDPEDAPAPVSDFGTIFAGVNILNNIVERTNDYELKSAILRYILQYTLDRSDFVKSLQLAKKLYVASSENFDDETIIYSSKVILYSLAELRQLSKIQEFLGNKAVQRVLPKQEGKAYISYVNLLNNKDKEIIQDYEANVRSYAKPVHPSILYNTGEAYFRQAEYDKAIKLFDEFTFQYPELEVASHARLRVAISYDLIDRPIKKVLKLYENAINRAVNPQISYEAKLRYVGLRVVRNKILEKDDLETLSFLEKSPAEKKADDNDLKKLLWLVRLRSFISRENYNDALAYLSTLPLEALTLVEKRTFEGDGAEIVVGLIKQLYLNEEYSRTVKTWEVYKDKYETKVAKSPYLSFMVCDAFLKLGLYDSFERSYKYLQDITENKTRTFPRWVKEHKSLDVISYMRELELIKYIGSNEWNKAQDFLEKLGNVDQKNINYNYYNGLVSYNLKQYNNAIENFEKILTSPNQDNLLSPRQTASMLTSYIESLYQSNEHVRFQKNAIALVKDINKGKNKLYMSVLERIEYLIIESLTSDEKPNYKIVEERAQQFIKTHLASNYLPRIKYLFGISLIRNKNEEQGKDVLNKLINNEGTPEYLKGLARSELSGLLIKNKML